MTKKQRTKSRSGRGVQGRRGRRYEMRDEAYERIEPLLPKQRSGGGQWVDHRIVLNGMFWVLNSGAQWRDMPERYGKWQTVYSRYRRWREKDCSIESSNVCTSSWTRTAESIGTCSTSMVRTSARISRQQVLQKKGRTRTDRPRPGTIARRLWNEASSSNRRRGHATGRPHHRGSGTRVEVL